MMKEKPLKVVLLINIVTLVAALAVGVALFIWLTGLQSAAQEADSVANRWEGHQNTSIYSLSDERLFDISNLDEVVEQLRIALKGRSRRVHIEISLQGDYMDNISPLVKELMELSFQPTGEPDEGDYLKFEIGGYNFTYTQEQMGPGYHYTISITPEYYSTLKQEEEVTAKVSEILDILGYPKDGNIDISNIAGFEDNLRWESAELWESDNQIESGSPEQSDIYNEGKSGAEQSSLGKNSENLSYAEYDRIRAVYDYITDNVSYDLVHKNNKYYTLKSTSYAALVNHSATCQGYAVSVYRLLTAIGVDCRIVRGTAINQAGEEVYHAWNIVRIGDKYYNIDATWGSISNKEQYFLKGSSAFAVDHICDEEYNLPEFLEAHPLSETDY